MKVARLLLLVLQFLSFFFSSCDDASFSFLLLHKLLELQVIVSRFTSRGAAASRSRALRLRKTSTGGAIGSGDEEQGRSCPRS